MKQQLTCIWYMKQLPDILYLKYIKLPRGMTRHQNKFFKNNALNLPTAIPPTHHLNPTHPPPQPHSPIPHPPPFLNHIA